ncbi:metallophosphoesterase [Microbacterium sp. X-17]|uniref:metallophosphoesterase n=1 Tax=Microbacterium sp. X-17 TaxID=3144404 RepID=UPI0031F4A548
MSPLRCAIRTARWPPWTHTTRSLPIISFEPPTTISFEPPIGDVMTSKPRVRIVTTNDLFGSFFHRRTSYGVQPGARSLVNAVDSLRSGAEASLWVDGGDFAQGGPLAPASGGTYGFATFRELGIDVATIGNHEFDWGEEHARRWLGEAGVPIVVANYDIGLPSTVLLDAGGVGVGVIGLTHPALQQFNSTLSGDQLAPEVLVPDLARSLRTSGADVIVTVIHDGVDWTTTVQGPLQIDTGRIEALVTSLRGHTDVLLGGHTLGRFIGTLADVPFVQPWAFGAEVGVLDWNADGSWTTFGVMLEETDNPWTGPGASANWALSHEVVGEISQPLAVRPWHDNSLAESMARGIAANTGADISLVFPQQLQTMQSPIDGTFAFLPAGQVSEADILRVVPFITDHVCQDVFVSEMTLGELEVLLECASGARPVEVDVALSPKTWGGPAVARNRQRTGQTISVAMASLYSERALAESWIGRTLNWDPTGTDLRAALRTDVAR